MRWFTGFPGRNAGLATVVALVAQAMVPAHAAPPPLSTYGQLPSMEMAAVSPSGNHVAFVVSAHGHRLLAIVDWDGQLVKKMEIGATKLRDLQWAGDDFVLAYYSVTAELGPEFTTSKAELGSAVVLSLKDGKDSKPWAIFAHDTSITGGVWGSYGVVQRDGHWYGYFGGITMNDNGEERSLPEGQLHPDLYEVDFAARRERRFAGKIDGMGRYRSWLLDPRGTIAAVLDFSDSTGDWAITNARHDPLVQGRDPLGEIWLVGLTPDGSGIIYGRRDRHAGTDDWFSVALAGGAAKPYLPGITLHSYYLDRGHRLQGYVEDNGTTAATHWHFFDPVKQRALDATQHAFPGARVELADASDNFQHLLVTTTGPQDPINWWVVDLATLHANPLGASYDIDPADVGPMRMVPYTAGDGLKMEGLLTLPPGRPAKGLPAVILPHGGPAAHDTYGFDWIAQAFASRGYAVFQPNFRGSTGYGVDFELAGHGEWGRKMQTDLSDGLAELVRQGIVDPARVCIVGASYGGYAALAGVTLQQGIYRCAVSVAGIGNLARMVADDKYDSADDELLIRQLREEVGKGRDLKMVSPIRFVDKVSVPVMLIHGKDDTVVHFEQSSAMAEALREAGKTVEMITLPGEDHWLSKGATREAMLEAAVGFVMRHNPADAGAAGVKK